ncbi:taste receptor type 2 member 143 [Mus musculus]|uniref:Taste receptor type 2 member 143 n=1 Tax=Mus musculus TaxID=10090 RepID=TR143_MOUSE|nr:taste receptor type 2 member 143 [Mus musculus]Q7TQB9.1 RecName: Full=Taste receptor type 2 member 143; Short=T2R143; AltName: Full=Taste receptor type 2 member 43; Short=T2R43; Short=mT2R36 [Mus musculus]AAI60236.1 Taste receptor, type 2, member 143 [synthetic construct]AAI48240.1 Taste receptor, type 2, member 143 [Mus musculus]AAN63042.1 putative taste receptor T2R43 [Mus musculus]DAA01235.1 TPA_exp: candidate taste receptor mt2r36 [Mus musculus]|eukprot:NP_001001452.1 taste receptor type 2 member 143 [Mus musculus]
MPSTPTLIFIIIFYLVSLASMLQNGFMMIVLGREWMRNRTLPAADMIVASLASSRFCLHGIAILANLLASFDFCYQANLIGILWDFTNTLIFWLTAWLAIFYCVKISSFSHPVLFWLKWRISQLVPRLLVVSLIIGGLSAVISATGNFMANQMTISQGFHGNCTFGHMSLDFYRYYYLYHSVLMWFTPFFLFLVSVIVLMFSLYQHVEKMRGHRPGPWDLHTQAHTMALKSLTFFFIFYIFFFLALVISSTKRKSMQSYYWAREAIIYTGIFLNSIILLFSNPKLRKALKMRF